MKPALAVVVIAATLCSVSSCLQETAPMRATATAIARPALDVAAASFSNFYPIALGDRWSYRDDDIVQVIPDQGPADPPFEDVGSIDVDMSCIESVGGHDYSVEHSAYLFDGYTSHTWVLYRQDRTGLFELDTSIFSPPSCAAGTASSVSAPRSLTDRVIAARPQYQSYRAALERLEAKRALVARALNGRSLVGTSALAGELTRLQYPLHPGATWSIRTDPAFVATVEGVDVLQLPAGRFTGYRIRIEAPGVFGSNDRVTTWYDRHGTLHLVAHLEGALTDANGQVIGKLITDETRDLTSLTLGGSTSF